MGNIYRNVSQTVLWLGLEADNSKVGIDFVNIIANDLVAAGSMTPEEDLIQVYVTLGVQAAMHLSNV